MPNVRRKNMKTIYSIIKALEDYKNGINAFEKILESQHSNRKLRKRAIEKASLNLLEDEEEYRTAKKSFKRTRKSSKVIDA
ncbi:ribosomal RNA processing protein 1 B [Caerostris extrusa]|uniref:Ribosomal RNA processing protein 1 B n=1 Tax=Caerostris extrusa TaxID=172846 RepID=A0AAV4RJE0_CAEEX|nr:ribosomal RNA processing protein 1 B [Caerostris extrusa]